MNSNQCAVKTMLDSNTITDEMLVAELYRLGVKHLARLEIVEPPNITPTELIKGLATSEDARVRGSLILLFLRYSSFHQYTLEASKQLPPKATQTLKLFYQAAFYLQIELEATLRELLGGWRPLPDLFSKELNLPSAGTSADQLLRLLGEKHRELTGKACNWSGSYRQNIPRFIKHLQRDYGHHNIWTIA